MELDRYCNDCVSCYSYDINSDVDSVVQKMLKRRKVMIKKRKEKQHVLKQQKASGISEEMFDKAYSLAIQHYHNAFKELVSR